MMSCLKDGNCGAALLVATLVLMVGCEYKKASKINSKLRDASARAQHGAGHDHADEGPHGGTLVEWGEGAYHAEVTFDPVSKQATVYILDKEATKTVPIPEESLKLTLTHVSPPVQISLHSQPQEGDPPGSSSRFVGTHEKLATKRDWKGEISGKVENKSYTGTFEIQPHDHAPKSK
jgi:hypothetical protein